MKIVITLIFSLSCVLLTADEPDVNWSQWRGNNRDSVATGNWPNELSESNLKTVWSKKFGPSYSGPIVLGDTVFVTETRDRKEEVVFALDINDGSKKWQLEWDCLLYTSDAADE